MTEVCPNGAIVWSRMQDSYPMFCTDQHHIRPKMDEMRPKLRIEMGMMPLMLLSSLEIDKAKHYGACFLSSLCSWGQWLNINLAWKRQDSLSSKDSIRLLIVSCSWIKKCILSKNNISYIPHPVRSDKYQNYGSTPELSKWDPTSPKWTSSQAWRNLNC